MTALVVLPGETKPGIPMTALVDLTGARQLGTQEALGAGTVPIPGKVKTAARVETAANHAAETTLAGGTEFFKRR
jgi:hypothetical protein